MMIFNNMQNQLETNCFTIVSKDHNRPWGGFFVIPNKQVQAFVNYYFDGLDISCLKIAAQLSPKILVVAPEK